jgi:hypothetical protein
MGWQRRGGRCYYYVTTWVDGRLVNQYVGRGPLAQLFAAEAEERHAERERVHQELRATQGSLQPLDELMHLLDRGTGRLLEADLRSRGLHRNHGHWRGVRRARTLEATR